MIIYNANGTELIEVQVDDRSERVRRIMGDHTLTLYFSLPEYIEIPLGCYCNYQGEVYTVEDPQNFVKNGDRKYEYTVKFQSTQAILKKFIFVNPHDHRLKFSNHAKPHEHLEMLVACMNEKDTGWTVGEYTDVPGKNIEFNVINCFAALQSIADAFETEWEVVGKTIHLRRMEYNKATPLPLAYGRGNGVKPGIERTNYNNKKQLERLYIQGGERNLDFSKYGSKTLLLPQNKELLFEGIRYKSDEYGYSIARTDRSIKTGNEDGLDLSHIYPSRIGSVFEVILVDEDEHSYDFTDESIPDTLDFNECRIGEDELTVIFQDGMLAGREFTVNYKHKDIVNGEEVFVKRFEIITQDTDGQKMPNDRFKPSEEDQYAVFGIMPPEEYVKNDANQTGASWDMFREAARYLYDNEQQQFSYKIDLDGIWSKNDWENISERIKLGGYVEFSDSVFEPEGVLIRIVAIVDIVNSPHKPRIELSNATVSSSITSILNKIEQDEVVIDQKQKESINYTKRRYRDAEESIKMLSAAIDGFSAGISPEFVKTVTLLIGDERLQYRFVDRKVNPVISRHDFVYNNEEKKLTTEGGIIQHMTLGITSMAPVHHDDEYSFWDLEAYESAYLDEPGKAYYLYIRAPKNDTQAVFFLSEDAYKFENDTDYYLLVGILTSEIDGERSFESYYGFTEVLPGRVLTELIKSSTGLNYFDLVSGAFKAGRFNSQGEMTAGLDIDPGRIPTSILKGTFVQSPSGDSSPVEVNRGAWESLLLYYAGDKVTYDNSTYLCIRDTPAAGIRPTNTTYWRIDAAKGQDGGMPAIIYCASNIQPDTPISTNPVPPGWSTNPPETEKITPIYSGDAWTDYNGYKRSLPIGHNGITKQRITFTTTKANSRLSFEIVANSEGNYDFMLIGLLDNPNLIYSSNYTDRVSGANVSKVVDIVVPSPGTHFLEFAYAKDQSQSLNGDYGLYKILSGDIIWMTTSVIINGVAGAWTTPVRVTGTDGMPGTDGRDGQDGKDGESIEFVFQRSTIPITPSSQNINNYVPSGWTSVPAGIDATHPMEFVSTREKTNNVWSSFSTPAQFKGPREYNSSAKEYIYARIERPITPATSQQDDYVPSGWTDDAQGISYSYPVEWACQRTKKNGVWSSFSAPAVWAILNEQVVMNKPVYQYAFDRPNTPTSTSPVPSGWQEQPDRILVNFSHQGQFILKPDGWREAPSQAATGSNLSKVMFTTQFPGQKIYLYLMVGIEENTNYCLVGALDVENATSSNAQTYIRCVSGVVLEPVEITVPQSGTHFICIKYERNTTAFEGNIVRYRMIEPTQCWISQALVQFNGTNWVAGNWTVPVIFNADSDNYEAIYSRTISEIQPNIPISIAEIDDYVPAGWSDNPQGVSDVWMYEWISERWKKDGKWGEFSTPAVWAHFGKGEKGDDGSSGPMPRCSVWDNDIQYEGSSTIMDVVMMVDEHGNVIVDGNGKPLYWRAKEGVGNIPIGVSPTDMTGVKWWVQMNWMDNVATNLLIATMALIAGFRFYNNRIESVNQTGGVPNFQVIGETGATSLAAGKFTFNGTKAQMMGFTLDEGALFTDPSKQKTLRISSGAASGEGKAGLKFTDRSVAGRVVTLGEYGDVALTVENSDALFYGGNVIIERLMIGGAGTSTSTIVFKSITESGTTINPLGRSIIYVTGASSALSILNGVDGQVILLVNLTGGDRDVGVIGGTRKVQRYRSLLLVYSSGLEGWIPNTD